MRIGYGPREMGNWLAGRVMRAIGRQGEEGAALLEFAITLPLLMTVLTGTVSFSLGLYTLQQIGNATAASAQSLAGVAGTVTDPCAWVAADVSASLPNLPASSISISISITDSGGTKHTPSSGTANSFTCKSDAQYMAPNEPDSVTVSYPYTWFPILSFSPSSSLQSTETVMAE